MPMKFDAAAIAVAPGDATAVSEAVAAAAARGVVILAPLNIRTGRQGYGWGVPRKSSHILAHLGDVAADRMSLAADDVVAERWYGSDDAEYPSWFVHGTTPVPLSHLVSCLPVAAYGADHVRAFGAGRGVIMKDLDAGRPLSWQMHVGIEEGYEVVSQPAGAGLFLGVQEAQRGGDLECLVAHVIDSLRRDVARPVASRRVLRVDTPITGIETPPGLESGLETFVDQLISGIGNPSSVADLLAYVMVQGRNVVDPTGFGWTDRDTFFPGQSLIQIVRPRVGERVVIRERMPHALFGWTAERGPAAVGWLREFKATSTGPRHAAVPTGDQTWSLADTLLGNRPRPGKVRGEKLVEALAVMREAGTWRRTERADFAATNDQPMELAPGVVFTRLHKERQFAACKMMLEEGRSARYLRHGVGSVLVVTEGAVRVRRASDGTELIGRLGLPDGWDGSAARSDEAMVFADRGDLIIESVAGASVVYDAHRPVPGVALTEAAAAF